MSKIPFNLKAFFAELAEYHVLYLHMDADVEASILLFMQELGYQTPSF
ncbi:MAG: hypothetical protein ACE5R6_02510 [Candidatus Heimdallarchaeota archaeon]